MSNVDENLEPKAGDCVVFYGSLMRGLGGLEQLPSASALRYIGPCQIHGELFDLGPYPGLRAAASGSVVTAELHAILDARVVEELDDFEGFEPERPAESLYLRKRVALLSRTRGALAPTDRRAWVYFYNHTPDSSQRVDSGDWRAHVSTRSESPMEAGTTGAPPDLRDIPREKTRIEKT
jgi:gamma-glutamylcyclotransferase (GGCT)/AIG2-like uncharacterized protein YtfP